MVRLYIEFTKPASGFQPLACAIAAVEGTKFSHVRLRWKNSAGVEVVYEASGTQVKFIGEIAQANSPVRVCDSFYIDLDVESYRRLIYQCMRFAGVSYGFLQLVGLLFMRVFKLKKNPYPNGFKGLICTELVARVLSYVIESPAYESIATYDEMGLREIHRYFDYNFQRTVD